MIGNVGKWTLGRGVKMYQNDTPRETSPLFAFFGDTVQLYMA